MTLSRSLITRDFQYFNKLLVKSLSVAIGLVLGASAWAGEDRWTVVGPWGTPAPILGFYKVLIAVHPTDSKRWYLAAETSRKEEYAIGTGKHMFYQSNNEGKSWSIFPEQAPWLAWLNENGRFIMLKISPSNPQTFYAIVDRRGDKASEFLKSEDGGKNWIELDNTLELSNIAIHPQDHTILYAYSSTLTSLVKSTDGGATWNSIGGTWAEKATAFEWKKTGKIVIDPTNASLIYAAVGYWDADTDKDIRIIRRSQDGGVTWQTLSETDAGIPPEIKFPYVTTNSTNSLSYKTENYTGGTLSVSTDQGETWVSRKLPEADWLTTEPDLSIYYKFGVQPSPVEENTFYYIQANYHTHQEWGFVKSIDAGKTWQTPTKIKVPMARYVSSSSNEGISSPLSSEIRYRISNGQLLKSTNDGANWQIVTTLPGGDQNDGDGYIKFGNSPETLYFIEHRPGGGDKDIHRSVDAGITWEHIYEINALSIQTFYHNPSDSNELYVFDYACLFSCSPKLMMKTVDGGKTWTNIEDALLPGTEVKYQEVNHMSGKGSTHYAATDKGIYISRNSGTTWSLFDIPGLPLTEMEVDEVHVDVNDPNVLYAYTDAGTFVYGKNSPPNINSAEFISETNNILKLAIYGNYLDTANLTVSLPDCANMTQVSDGDDMTQYFECQAATRATKNGSAEIKDADGTVLGSFPLREGAIIFEAGQCATFSLEQSPHLQLPCVDNFKLGMNWHSEITEQLIFGLELNFLADADDGFPENKCGKTLSMNTESESLQLMCLDIGDGNQYWLNMPREFGYGNSTMFYSLGEYGVLE